MEKENRGVDNEGNELNPGDRIMFLYLLPSIRFSRIEAYTVSMPGKKWTPMPPDEYDPEENPLLGTLLRKDIPFDDSWIIRLDRPIFYGDKTQDGSLDVTELQEMRFMGNYLKKLP